MKIEYKRGDVLHSMSLLVFIKELEPITYMNTRRKVVTRIGEFICDCGKKCLLRIPDVRSGHTKSCGCFGVSSRIKHGLYREPLHKVWRGMISRCSNKSDTNYKNYGGKGVSVCREWLNPHPFIQWGKDEGYSQDLQIDRVDNILGYSPLNCRWVTAVENCQNRSTSKIWTVHGVDYASKRSAGDALGVSLNTIASWCDGHSSRGVFYPPKKGCYSKLKYPETLEVMGRECK